MTLLQRARENIELGREEGRKEGSNRMASLTKILLSENRIEDHPHPAVRQNSRDQFHLL